ncbi:MAG: protein translocase subunit SecF [Patescibacteria group bacterium]
MIKFTKYIWLYFLISSFVLSAGIYSLVRFGLRPSIDFAGGTLVELRVPSSVSADDISTKARSIGMEVSSVQRSGKATFLVRSKSETDATITTLAQSIASESAVIVLRKETVGPILGKELLQKASVAAAIAITVILLYVAYAFKNIKYGVSAIIALVHDVMVVIGMFSLFGHFYGVEVDTLFVTAVLTAMSFSVHDTIVVFDRIREYLRRDRSRPFEELVNVALTETMNRSITNSFTIIFMLVALILMGGDSIRWFIVALLIGTVSGTYSSPFIAVPILFLWHKWEKEKAHTGV